MITAQSAVAAKPAAQSRDEFALTDKQYSLLLDLFHEMNDEFKRLSLHTQSAFFQRLYAH